MNSPKVSATKDFYLGLADFPIFGFHPNLNDALFSIDGNFGASGPNTKVAEDCNDGDVASLNSNLAGARVRLGVRLKATTPG